MATTRTSTGNTFARPAKQAVRQAVQNPWLERLARFGFAARGGVYAIIGVLAVQAAFLGRGETTDTRGALEKIGEQSHILLALAAAGFAGYALWRFAQAFLDPEHKGTDLKGLVQRGAMFGTGVIYAGLAWAAVRALLGTGRISDGGGQRLTASLLDKPMGRWLVVLAGLCVIASGIGQLVKAWKKSFAKKLMTQQMDEQERRLALRTGQLGMASRGVVFLIAGGFLAQAGWRYDPSKARGLRGALEALAAQPHGQLLLGIVAIGLVAFGAYSFLEARYRRIVF
jgi:hypothetical protein